MRAPGMNALPKPLDAERRSAILEAAERLFRHYGPSKTTIGDIAREVGIGVGSVYLEFCSKEEIVTHLAQDRRERVFTAMRGASREGTFADRLVAVMEARVEAFFALQEQGVHSCDLLLCSESEPVWGRFQREELALVASLLEQGARAGEFGMYEVKPTAELFNRAFATLSPPWLFELQQQEAVRVARSMTQLFVHGLRARRRPQAGSDRPPPPRRKHFGAR